MELGNKIRTLRKQQDKSIEDLAKSTGLSKGLISQIERDLTGPSVSSLFKIANSLNVTMNYFFDQYDNFNRLVRKDERKKLQMKNANRIYELLSPNLRNQIEMISIKIEPGESNYEDSVTHEGEECGVVIKGSLRVISDEKVYDLNEGDSIYLDSTIPHKYLNIGDETSISIWAMVPPSF